MSSLLISGYFAVASGRRIASENPTTRKTTHHMYYDTVVQTSGIDVAAELRIWVPSSEQPLPDGTIVDVLAKVHAPANGTLQLDAILFFPFPGDASNANYEDNIPDRPFPTLFVLGHTVGTAETMDDGVSIGYQVQASEYVRDQTRSSRLYCRFDGTKPRWKKTPRPPAGSAVFIVGLAYGLHLAGGNLMVDVDQVQLNVGTSPASVSAPRAEQGGPPAKRRRFPTATTAAGAATAGDTEPAAGSQSGTSRRENPFASQGSEPAQASEDSTSAASTSAQPTARPKKAGGRRRAAVLPADENDVPE